jgi:hypothetical protein
MAVIKEVICKAESTRPPKVSISKTIKPAPWLRAFRVSRRTKTAIEGSISPRMGMIHAEPAVSRGPESASWPAALPTAVKQRRRKTAGRNPENNGDFILVSVQDIRKRRQTVYNGGG